MLIAFLRDAELHRAHYTNEMFVCFKGNPYRLFPVFEGPSGLTLGTFSVPSTTWAAALVLMAGLDHLGQPSQPNNPSPTSLAQAAGLERLTQIPSASRASSTHPFSNLKMYEVERFVQDVYTMLGIYLKTPEVFSDPAALARHYAR